MAMLLLPALSAFALSVLLHLLALKLFPRLGLLDFPERYGLSRPRLPYPTGILSVITFLVVVMASLPQITPRMLGVLGAVALLCVVCFVDDRTPLSPLLRIGAQLAAAGMLILSDVRIGAVTNPLPGSVLGQDTSILLQSGTPYAFSVVFTVLWVLLTVNALNWFDGVPGQVSALSTIAFLTIGFLSLSDRVQQPWIALLAFLLAGIGAASMIFDFPPPRVLMGDSGAMFFGLLIGVLTIYAGGKVATAFLVLGVPLIDVLFVIIRRIARGESPLRGNAVDQHLHHRLLRKGWSPRQIMLLTAGLGTAFGVTALFLSTFEKFAAATVLLLVMLALSHYSTPHPPHS